MNLPKSVTIHEVTLRDGLQDIDEFVATTQKIQLMHALKDADFKRLEVTAFVNPKRVPQMSDAAELAAQSLSLKDIEVSALVPNLMGYQRALEAGIRSMVVFMSASESHNQANMNMSREQSLNQLAAVAEQAKKNGCRLRLNLATAFGCPYEGAVKESEVFLMVKHAVKMGYDEIDLCDTTGVASPLQVERVFSGLIEQYPHVPFAAHFHQRGGWEFANVLAALQAGVQIYDSCMGGLGGCPFAPGASGNIDTEKLIGFFNLLNISHGINESKLQACRRLLP